MHVRRLRVQNFRAFFDFSIDFYPGFNLLIGDNQSGKTAVLDAISIGLSCFFQGFPTGASLGIDKSDVRRAMYKLGDTVQMPAQYPVKITCVGHTGQKQIEWSRSLKSARSRTGKALTQLGMFGQELNPYWQSSEIDLPVLAYFGTERVSRQRRSRPDTPDKLKDRSLGYKDCLERDSNLRLIRSWIKQQTLAEAQKAHRGLASSAGAQLRAIERAVCACVPEVKQFFYDIEYHDLTVVFADGRRLPWPMLSDGVRSLATLAMDLGWRAAVLNPHRGDQAAESSSGVVLLDEIDLALHPKWQRRVVDDLTNAFPRMQFIATTHSPQVLASAARAHVLQLVEGVAYPVDRAYGKDSNTVLTDIMHAPERPEEIVRALKEVRDFIDREQINEAREKIAILEEKLAADDTELVRLRTAIWFATPPTPEPTASEPPEDTR